MENHLREAIEQMRRNEEDGMRYIYSQTYNFVYLRAKSILKREDDIQKLMKEVYVQAAAQSKRISEGNLYEWLGRWTYILGSGKYRRKKVREATNFEWEDNDYAALKTISKDSTREIICNTLEELPDMYQATLYAFYYDQMKIKDIAKTMDYSEGAIINRLNYTYKYLEKALELYEEETKVKVQLSPAAINKALQDWSKDNYLSATAAQTVYLAISRELQYPIHALEVDEREMAGAEMSVAKHAQDDITAVMDELEYYSAKPGLEKKQIAIIGGIAVVLVVLVLIAVLVSGTDKNKGKQQPEDTNQISQNGAISEDETPDEQFDDEETTKDEPVQDEETNGEYILPQSNTVKLTREDLAGLTKEQLRLARNEIYARHGMIFGREDLAAYFSSKSWYEPTVAFDDFYNVVEMSEIEEANVVFILEIENEME